jgi:cellulose synthase/poly-beta-1,6-N-acetylglucosamine synthase-like glycosyltransferase
VEFVPDAKALTDAPPNLTLLLKQRRRWMNGALFGTFKVQQNFFRMISCMNRQPCLRQLMMCMFMIYLIASFMLQFVTIGVTFSSIVIFLVYVINTFFKMSNSVIL